MIGSVREGKPGPPADVLAYLKRDDTRFITSRELAESLNLKRQHVYDSVSYLRTSGYEIEAGRNKGYKLISSPDRLLPIEIAANMSCRFFARRIFCYKTIGSTNTVAQDLAKSGLPEGTLVTAETQTKGRGRLGRKWYSPPGKGLYFSIILKPDLAIDKIAGLSLVAGLAITRAVYDIIGIQTKTKWPNDVLYKTRKLAGILVEGAAELDKIDYMVVGCGINVNHLRKDFPLSLQRKSTSLKIIVKKDLSRVALLQAVLRQFESLYENYCRHGFRYLSAELIKNSVLIGKKITLKSGNQKVAGRAMGIDNSGRLIIKNKKGLMTYPAGEVTLR
ncbi:MAG: biotin--[acetyl-CoA-carboxylase] ligase [candidate division Zixibacteria bacterium]|nr:biotin--[acetyl-CoA-carboxylase] ligase [candidate division Zixibacteria bacterium]